MQLFIHIQVCEKLLQKMPKMKEKKYILPANIAILSFLLPIYFEYDEKLSAVVKFVYRTVS